MAHYGIWQNTLEFTCTWDLGRRCSLDCSYCPPHRHNNWSEHADFDALKSAARLPLKYSAIFRKYAEGSSLLNISFTGGEPTLNPNFLELCRYISSQDADIRVGVTTNGLFSDSYAEELAKTVDFVTLSYHFEAIEKSKNRIQRVTAILQDASENNQLKISDFNVNVMVHAYPEYFLECKGLVAQYNERGVRFSLREIGEHPDDKGSHDYTDEQLEFLRGGKKKAIESSCSKPSGSCSTSLKRTSGRPCCGGRSFKELTTSEENVVPNFQWVQRQVDGGRVYDRNFKGWSCLVHLFFLHIHQESGDVFYHQTCQANGKGGRGPIGNLKDTEQILETFSETLDSKKIRPIVCPNKKCNCGLCITKSPEPTVLQTFLDHSFPGLEIN